MKFDARPTNLYTEITQARRLTLFGYITRMDDNVDAKHILTSSPSVYWKRPPGRPRMTWMKTVQNDLDSHGLSWTDAVDLAQNWPLWRLLATSGATHLWCSRRWWWWWWWGIDRGMRSTECHSSFSLWGGGGGLLPCRVLCYDAIESFSGLQLQLSPPHPLSLASIKPADMCHVHLEKWPLKWTERQKDNFCE